MKLLHLWRHLNKSQQKDISKNLATQVPKMRTDTLRLLAYLTDNKDLTEVNFDKTAVFAYIYPEKPYNDNWLRLAQSQLVRGIEQFFAQRKLCADTGLIAQATAELYAGLQTHTLYFEHSLENLREQQQRAIPQDETHYLRRLATEGLYLQHTTKKRAVKQANIQEILELQEQFMAAAQLRTVCTALSQQAFSALSFSSPLFEAVLARIEAAKWQDTEPLIGAYYYIYKMAANPENIDFFQIFRQNMPKYIALFTTKECYEMYIYAINYAIKYANKGDEVFVRTIFELYKEGIEQSILRAENGELNAITFRNTVTTGLRVGESAYIALFLERYKPHLPRSVRRNYYEHGLARYCFAVKDFERAKTLLLGLDYGEISLQLDAKMILIKIYYETDEHDLLEAHLSSFRQFLHRKRSKLGYHQENYKNIIDFSKKLISSNLFDKDTTEILRQEIQATSPLTEREWLLAQLNVK
jgi:hypothetical protein